MTIGRTQRKPGTIPAESAARDHTDRKLSRPGLLEFEKAFAGFGAPKFRVGGHRPGHQRPAIRTEVSPIHGALFRQFVQQVSRLSVIYPNGAVFAAGQQARAVRTELHMEDVTASTQRRTERLTSGSVP